MSSVEWGVLDLRPSALNTHHSTLITHPSSLDTRPFTPPRTAPRTGERTATHAPGDLPLRPEAELPRRRPRSGDLPEVLGADPGAPARSGGRGPHRGRPGRRRVHPVLLPVRPPAEGPRHRPDPQGRQVPRLRPGRPGARVR